MIKYSQIFFEGIDKSGKELISKYVDILGNHKYILSDRGIISNITYSRMFGRDYSYDISKYKDCIFVYLTVDEADWNIRCKLTNEPKISYQKNIDEFDETIKNFKYNGFYVIEYNTSLKTPYAIAKSILNYVDQLNAK